MCNDGQPAHFTHPPAHPPLHHSLTHLAHAHTVNPPPPQPPPPPQVMGCMRDIRKRKDRTDAMFEPLTATVDLLRQHMHASADVVPERAMQKLEEVPGLWKNLEKKMEAKKEEVRDGEWVVMVLIENLKKKMEAKEEEVRGGWEWWGMGCGGR